MAHQFDSLSHQVGPRFVIRSEMKRHVAGLALVDLDQETASAQIELPSDMFLLTVVCDESLTYGSARNDDEFSVTVGLLRASALEVRVRGRGQLATALLTPMGAMKLLRAPFNGVADLRVPLASFFGRAEQSRLCNLIRSSTSRQQRLLHLGRWLEEKLSTRQTLDSQQTRAFQASTLLQQSRRLVQVSGIAEKFGLSRRQLERDFQMWLGASPALYGRLCRFQKAARGLADGDRFLDVAVDNDYTDQPHLNRAVKEFTGMTPGELSAAAREPRRVAERASLAGRVLFVDSPESRLGVRSLAGC